MPVRDKLKVSVIVVALTALLTLWEGSPIRADFAIVVAAFSGIALLVLWLFPESGLRE